MIIRNHIQLHCECGCNDFVPWGEIKIVDNNLFIEGHEWVYVKRKAAMPKFKKLSLSMPIEQSNGCWIWQGSFNMSGGGYGQFLFAGHMRQAHRLFYQLFKGPIPEKYHVHHKCEDPKCVNPDHLEALGHREHLSRHQSSKLSVIKAREIRCLYGTGNYSYRKIADIYSVSREMIRLVVLNRSWKEEGAC